jgi:hypothetical protein
LAFLGIDLGPSALGARRLPGQAGHPTGLKLADHIAHGLVAAADLPGDLRCPLASGTGQQDMAASQAEGIVGPQASTQVLFFLAAQRSDKNGSFHGLIMTQPSLFQTGRLILH